MVRLPVGSAEVVFAAVNPSMAPPSYSWCAPFHEWLRSATSQYLVS